MSKAGKKLIKSAREAVAIARGEKMPARATRYGWMTWSPDSGLCGGVSSTRKDAELWCFKSRGERPVRVKIETLPSTGQRGK